MFSHYFVFIIFFVHIYLKIPLIPYGRNKIVRFVFFLSFSFLNFVLVAIRGGLLLLLFSIGIRKHTTAISTALHELICWPIYSVLGVRQMNCSFSVKGTWTKWFFS